MIFKVDHSLYSRITIAFSTLKDVSIWRLFDCEVLIILLYLFIVVSCIELSVRYLYAIHLNCYFACRCIKGEPAIEEYYEMYLEAEGHSNEISEAVMQSQMVQQFLMPGRVVVVKSQSVSSVTWFLHLYALSPSILVSFLY